MNILEFALLLVVAAVLGIVSQRVTGFRVGGLIASIVLGFVGAFLGKELALALQLPDILYLTIGGKSIPVIWAVLGGMAVTFLVGWVQIEWKRSKLPVEGGRR